MKPIAALMAALFSLSLAAGADAQGPGPQPGTGSLFLDKGHGRLDIGGGQPGTDVFVLGAGSLLSEEIVYQYFRSEIIHDKDRDGDLAWEHGQPEAARDLWLAVDLHTGDFDVIAPTGAGGPLASLPTFGLDSTLTRLDVAGADLQLAVVRPSKGAYSVRSLDGRDHDADNAADGWLSFSFGDADSSVGLVGAATFEPGDRLFFIDPERFTVAVTDLTQADIDSAAGAQGGTGSQGEGL